MEFFPFCKTPERLKIRQKNVTGASLGIAMGSKWVKMFKFWVNCPFHAILQWFCFEPQSQHVPVSVFTSSSFPRIVPVYLRLCTLSLTLPSSHSANQNYNVSHLFPHLFFFLFFFFKTLSPLSFTHPISPLARSPI